MLEYSHHLKSRLLPNSLAAKLRSRSFTLRRDYRGYLVVFAFIDRDGTLNRRNNTSGYRNEVGRDLRRQDGSLE